MLQYYWHFLCRFDGDFTDLFKSTSSLLLLSNSEEYFMLFLAKCKKLLNPSYMNKRRLNDLFS